MANVGGDTMQSKINSAKNEMINKTQSLGGTLEKASRELGDRIGSVAGEVTERASDYYETTCSYIRQKPMQSVLIAAATGLFVGNILGMVSRRRG